MQRDARFDTLRGLALVVMTLTHVPYPLHQHFLGTLGFASFAHVFVFLSGFVAGLVYLHLAPRMSAGDVWRKALGRVRTIWVMHVVVTVLIVGYVVALDGAGIAYAEMPTAFVIERPALAVGLSAALLYLPGYTHILAMYVFFIALLAPAVLALRKGRTGLVLGASAALWIVAQLGARRTLLAAVGEHVTTHAGYYDVLAWQVLFVVGVVTGTAYARGTLQRIRIAPSAAALLLGAHAALMAIRHGWWSGAGVPAMIREFASDELLGPARLLGFAIVALLTSEAMRRWPAAFRIRWLALLGRHSMTVFVLHVVLVCATTPIPVAQRLHVPAAAAIVLLLVVAAWAADVRRRRVRASRALAAAA